MSATQQPSTLLRGISSGLASAAPLSSTVSDSNSPLHHQLKQVLGRRLDRVQEIDDDVDRFTNRATFGKFVLERYSLLSLAAQGELSTLRQVVHIHLISSLNAVDGDAAIYREHFQRLYELPDPWASNAGGTSGSSSSDSSSSSSNSSSITSSSASSGSSNTSSSISSGESSGSNSSSISSIEVSLFKPEPSKIYTSSSSNSHLAAAQNSQAAIDKALNQLAASLDGPRAKALAGDATAVETLKVREDRIKEMEAKKRKFEDLEEVLQVLENMLNEKKQELLERIGGEGNEEVGESIKANSRAWGKSVEKEGQKVIELCIQDLLAGKNQQQQQQKESLKLLTGVLIQSLDGPELMEIRKEIIVKKPIYRGVESPKGELDGLIVFQPHQQEGEEAGADDGAGKRLHVVLPVEMKRSLDEVAGDCLKFALLLEICREASSLGRSDLIRFTYGRQSTSSPKGREGISSAGGFVLDFAADLPATMADMAIYLTKRGGNRLRATQKLLMEQLSLFGGAGFSDAEVSSRILRFYAPHFVDVDDSIAMAQAEAERKTVIDEMYESFLQHGKDGLERRMKAIRQTLCDENVDSEGGARVLKNVYSMRTQSSPSSPVTK